VHDSIGSIGRGRYVRCVTPSLFSATVGEEEPCFSSSPHHLLRGCMKKLFFALFIVVTVASGCSTYYPVYESRRDPVVGRTTDGRRIYEDRKGRLYTLDRNGRRVYRDSGHTYKGNSKKYKVKKAKPGRRVKRGPIWGHPGKGKRKGRNR